MSDDLTQLSQLTATEAITLIRSGKISALELVDACIARIEAANPELNAVVTTCFERARAQASALAGVDSESLPPLAGVPVLIKDNQLTEGVVTTLGSPLHRDRVPVADAGIVKRLRAAGAIVLGKTNIPEFSIGANTTNPLFGTTCNPFDTGLTCGGSSGGSAVAVAANMAPLATGSDHGGSLRIPASYCGVVGYRASPGMVPNEERTTPTTHYSLQGPITRSVEDAALMLSVIADRGAGGSRDPMAYPLDASRFQQLDAVDLSSLRVAVSADLGGLLVSAANQKAFAERVEQFSALFQRCDWHDISLVDAPAVDWLLRQDVFVTQYFDQADDWPADVNPNLRATYDTALKTPMADIAAARRRQLELIRTCQDLFADYDLLIVPGMSVPPFPHEQLYPEMIDGKPVENYMGWLHLTASLTVVGHPVVMLPAGLDAGGLPFGLQVVGPMYADHRLLSAAKQLEQAFQQVDLLRRPICAAAT
ncbi:MAG: amidase [Pseudomonadota bacterium]